MNQKDKENLWHKWPQEKPSKTGEYLCRGIGGLNNKLHHYVCLWVGEDACQDKGVTNKFYFGGNEFCLVIGKNKPFEFINVNEL